MGKEAEQFWEDMQWGENNYAELVKRYPDKWVAIVNKKVVAFGESLRNIEIEAERKANKKKERDDSHYFCCGDTFCSERFGGIRSKSGGIVSLGSWLTPYHRKPERVWFNRERKMKKMGIE